MNGRLVDGGRCDGGTAGRPVLGVVVPAHDEQELLPGCLDALARAVRALDGRATVRTVVALDACTDGSAGVARAAGATTVRLVARRVGAARRAGVDALLATGPVDWIATTDADSAVPAGWLHAHLDALADGHDALVGTVAVTDWADHPDDVRSWFRDVYDLSGDPHPHVHGANLGVRTSAYRAVGGFAPLRTGEDVALVAALGAGGHRVHRTRTTPVATSARRVGRAEHGFAGRLVSLGGDRTAPPVAGARAGSRGTA